jgi:C4-dicarboxylate transporter DctQ subunit
MERISDVVSAVICLALGWYAIEFVKSSHALGERGMAIPIKLWPIQLILPWMFFSSAIRHLIFAASPALRPVPKGEMH